MDEYSPPLELQLTKCKLAVALTAVPKDTIARTVAWKVFIFLRTISVEKWYLGVMDSVRQV